MEARWDFATAEGLRCAIATLRTATHEDSHLWDVSITNDEAYAVVWRRATLRWWEYLPLLAWSSRRLGPQGCYVYPDGTVNLIGFVPSADGGGMLPAPSGAIDAAWLDPRVLAAVIARATTALESLGPVSFRLEVRRGPCPVPDGSDVRVYVQVCKAGAPGDAVTVSSDAPLTVVVETDLAGRTVSASGS